MKKQSLILPIVFLFLLGCELTDKRVTKNKKAAEQDQNVALDLPRDSDGDGLSDELEKILGTDPQSADSDRDGLSDGEEHNTYGTDPLKADTDEGGIDDGAEIKNGTDPSVSSDDISNDHDTDGDGLGDQDEVELGTDPQDNDTDNDGLSDGAEVNTYLTNPRLADTDSGGTPDGQEVDNGTNPRNDPYDDSDSSEDDTDQDGLSNEKEAEIGTDPNNADSDNDGATDGEEVNTYGTDPLDADTDDGGVSDGDEISSGTDPFNKGDDNLEALDSDSDGLSDAQEIAIGTDRENPDTDEDGLLDGAEVNTHGTDPIKEDTDDGGINDGDEVSLGTDPLVDADDFLKPALRIVRAPKNQVTSRRAKFQVTTQDLTKVADVHCALDGEEVTPCEIDSVLVYKGLELGTHVFQMTVVDLLGRTSSVEREWHIKERVFKGCEGKARRFQEVSIEVPARSNTCRFGDAGNLKKKNVHLQAQETDSFQFSLGESFDICELEMNIESNQFKADDHFALSWNNKVLMANADFMLTTTTFGKTFDFEQVKGMKFSGESSYCFANGPGSSCSIPKHDKNGEIQLIIGEDDEENLISHLNRQSLQTLSLSVTGDNDSSDCQHSGLNIQLKIYKARVR